MLELDVRLTADKQVRINTRASVLFYKEKLLLAVSEKKCHLKK